MTAISITGIGVISSIGIGREAFWEGCQAVRSGLGIITDFDTQPYRSNIAAPVKDFKPADFMAPMTYRRMSRISRMAVAASIEALEDSGIDIAVLDKERIGVVVGTAYGSSAHIDGFFCSLLADGPRGAQPMLFPETVPNAPASHIAICHQIQGPNATFCQNEISAETAMVYARNLLEKDEVDMVIVGGAEELSEILFACYDAVGALNRIRVKEDEPIIPKARGGLVLGEGAAVFVMERSDDARQRGARIYGQLVSDVIGGGVTAMGHYAIESQKAEKDIKKSLIKAGLKPEDIHQVSVSTNNAKELDAMEIEQIENCLTPEDGLLRVTPLKYLIGDFGAAGLTRAAATLLSLYHQVTLPTMDGSNLVTGGDNAVTWNPSEKSCIQNALMTSYTFGGGMASMVFSRENK